MENPISVGYLIEQSSKDLLDGIALKAGVSSSAMLELVLQHTALNADGIPVWFTRPETDGELPIDSR